MNKNFIRIGIGALLGIVVLTVLLMQLKEPGSLLYIGYVWSLWAIIVFALGLGVWAIGSETRYLLYASYALLLKFYLFITIGIAFFFGILSYSGLWTIHWGWFCLIEFIVLAITAWRLQAMDAAKDEIMSVENSVREKVLSWKMLTAEVNAIFSAADGERKKEIAAVYDAVRYADPMSNANLTDIENEIKENIAELASAEGDISSLCQKIILKIKQRNEMCKLLK